MHVVIVPNGIHAYKLLEYIENNRNTLQLSIQSLVSRHKESKNLYIFLNTS